MSKKISQEEFLSRFHRSYPDAEIGLINYTAISNPLEIVCKKCGKHYKKLRAREFLTSFTCCEAHNETKEEKLKKIYEKNNEFDYVKKVDRNYYIVHHNKCGQDIKRTFVNGLDNPFACKYCNTSSTSQKIDIREIQERLDQVFFGTIQILDYNGQLEKNHYKCLKCGLIFVQQQTCLMQSRGCPKCDKYKSNGEKQMIKILEDNGINFREQVAVKELPLQHFDFGVYDEQDNLQYFIEVQGEQHRENRKIFKDSLEKIQERDNRKKKYCLSNNIPLYEIIYQKGKLLNLDILPFSSTTISAKESTL